MSKKLFILPAFIFGAILIFTATSCGDDCKFDQKDFIGDYLVSEDCSSSAAASYNVTISANGETDVKITGFWEYFSNTVNATVDCETITIPRQKPDSGDDFFVEGSGTIEKSGGNVTINLTYTVTDEADPANIKTDNCSSTVYTKK